MKKILLLSILLSFNGNQLAAQVQLGSDIDGEAANDNSGRSIALSSDGTIVAIGAHNNDGGGIDAGHVRVYQYSSGSWTQLGGDIDGEAADDRFGCTVSLSSDGSILGVGAYGNDGNGLGAGHVRIYKYSSNGWSQLGGDIDGEATDDRFGCAVSLSSLGDTVVIGANQNDGAGSDAGHCRVFSTDTNNIGINTLAFEYQLKVYPNPANQFFIVDIPEEMINNEYTLEILNFKGLVYQQELNKQQLYIHLNLIAAGTYTLLLKNSGGIIVNRRVIILQ